MHSPPGWQLGCQIQDGSWTSRRTFYQYKQPYPVRPPPLSSEGSQHRRWRSKGYFSLPWMALLRKWKPFCINYGYGPTSFMVTGAVWAVKVDRLDPADSAFSKKVRQFAGKPRREGSHVMSLLWQLRSKLIRRVSFQEERLRLCLKHTR